MGHRRAVLVAAVVVSAVVGVPPAEAVAPAHTKPLSATLTGAAERPGPGDPDASGLAAIWVDLATQTLCLHLEYQNVDGTPSGLHIHFAPPTAPGPVVVPFSAPAASPHNECVIVANAALLANIVNNPQQYYINLHSTPLYPGGAIRGQLARPLLRLRADLTGAAERPGPGDPDGEGTFDAWIDDPTNTLCYLLRYQNVDGTPSGLHIHLAPPTAPGPVVVPFAAPTASPAMGCVVIANEALGDNLVVNQAEYYVNLHSVPLYPGGAIRGQLPGCTITGGQRLTGTEGDDVLCGGPAAEQIFGNGGDDAIFGAEGGGYLDGGTGHDLVVGGSATENVFGQDGDDAGFAGGGVDRCQSLVIADGCEQVLG